MTDFVGVDNPVGWPRRFTAEEVIGYIRVCRPGSVIGPQQGFIKDIQRIMWLEGDAYRAKHGPNPPPLMWGITPAAAASSCGSCSGGCGSVCAPVTSSVSISLLVDATGRKASADGSPATPTGAAVAAASRLAGATQSEYKHQLEVAMADWLVCALSCTAQLSGHTSAAHVLTVPHLSSL